MSLRRRLVLLGLCAALPLPLAPSATAGVFPGEVIDGPNPDLVSVGGLDIARDGTGAVAYIRRDGGVEHVFVSRLVDGAFGVPERIDGAIGEPAAAAVIAAGDRGRLVAAWVGGGTLYASVRPSLNAAWSPPQALGAPAAEPAVDLSVNGHAYVAWTSAGDVRAARLERGATQLTPVPAPLDLDPARPASDPTVAVAGDGLAVIAWTEVFGDGTPHVVAQRIASLEPFRAPQDLSGDPFEGRFGGAADQPQAQIEEDSSYGWVAYRQSFPDGQRGLARHLRGARFEPAVGIDGQAFPAEAVGSPQIAVNGSGVGVSAVGRASGTLFSSPLDNHVFGAALRVDAMPSPLAVEPRAVAGENDTALVVWPGADAQLRGRELDEGRLRGELPFSDPALGPVDVGAGLAASTARTLDAAVAAIQGAGADRRLVADFADREPGYFAGYTGSAPRRDRRPLLKWGQPLNLWGPLVYTIEIDGRTNGRTTRTSGRPSRPIRAGSHRWRVIATDRRGQESATATRLLRIERKRHHH